jgi:hypothetical protein
MFGEKRCYLTNPRATTDLRTLAVTIEAARAKNARREFDNPAEID